MSFFNVFFLQFIFFLSTTSLSISNTFFNNVNNNLFRSNNNNNNNNDDESFRGFSSEMKKKVFAEFDTFINETLTSHPGCTIKTIDDDEIEHFIEKESLLTGKSSADILRVFSGGFREKICHDIENIEKVVDILPDLPKSYKILNHPNKTDYIIGEVKKALQEKIQEKTEESKKYIKEQAQAAVDVATEKIKEEATKNKDGLIAKLNDKAKEASKEIQDRMNDEYVEIKEQIKQQVIDSINVPGMKGHHTTTVTVPTSTTTSLLPTPSSYYEALKRKITEKGKELGQAVIDKAWEKSHDLIEGMVKDIAHSLVDQIKNETKEASERVQEHIYNKTAKHVVDHVHHVKHKGEELVRNTTKPISDQIEYVGDKIGDLFDTFHVNGSKWGFPSRHDDGQGHHDQEPGQTTQTQTAGPVETAIPTVIVGPISGHVYNDTIGYNHIIADITNRLSNLTQDKLNVILEQVKNVTTTDFQNFTDYLKHTSITDIPRVVKEHLVKIEEQVKDEIQRQAKDYMDWAKEIVREKIDAGIKKTNDQVEAKIKEAEDIITKKITEDVKKEVNDQLEKAQETIGIQTKKKIEEMKEKERKEMEIIDEISDKDTTDTIAEYEKINKIIQERHPEIQSDTPDLEELSKKLFNGDLSEKEVLEAMKIGFHC
eukprot:Awhi_evm1s8235